VAPALALGYVAGDITVGLFLQRYPHEAPDPAKLPFLKGLIYPNWLAWQLGSFIGIMLGAVAGRVGPGAGTWRSCA
jgi:predicted branched-subunit amino acid permease